MMRNIYLENLRAKPEPVRRRIAAIVSIALTAVVVGVWLINLSVSSNAPAVAQETNSFSLFGTLDRIRVGFSVAVQSVRNLLP